LSSKTFSLARLHPRSVITRTPFADQQDDAARCCRRARRSGHHELSVGVRQGGGDWVAGDGVAQVSQLAPVASFGDVGVWM